MEYLIHPACEVFPMMGADALAELAEDIRRNGLLEPLTVWDGVLLDGRNRLAACDLAGVTPAVEEWAPTGDAVAWVMSKNMQRRHLTTGQRAYLAAQIEPLYAAEAAERMLAGVGRDDPGADLPQGADERAPRARDHAAAVAKTSGRAVAQFKRVAREAPDLAEKVAAGDMALDRAERVVRDRVAEAVKVEKALEQAAAVGTVYHVDVREGDFRSVLADLRNVDAIITDPPYPREFLPLLDDLATWADMVLSPDGVLAVLIGQTHLPEVYARLEGSRPYRWTACYLTEGPGYVSHPRRVQSSWKPLLVYGGGPRFGDLIRSSGDDKRLHKWGQNFDAFTTIIERLTEPGQTVVDPFMGGGTTLLAAHALGRHAIGCDLDPEAVASARERFS